jgi:hypothetical protein
MLSPSHRVVCERPILTVPPRKSALAHGLRRPGCPTKVRSSLDSIRSSTIVDARTTRAPTLFSSHAMPYLSNSRGAGNTVSTMSMWMLRQYGFRPISVVKTCSRRHCRRGTRFGGRLTAEANFAPARLAELRRAGELDLVPELSLRSAQQVLRLDRSGDGDVIAGADPRTAAAAYPR